MTMMETGHQNDHPSTTAVARKADEAVAEAKKLLVGAEGAEKEATGALEAANKKAVESEKKIQFNKSRRFRDY